MKTNRLGFLLAAFWVLCAPSIHAADFGGYVDLGAGSGSVTEDDSLFWDGYTRSVSASSLGLGLVFDSDARTGRVFGFRLRGGYDALSLEDSDNQDLALGGWTVDALFMLGSLVGSDRSIRLWAGPMLQSGYYRGELKNPSDPGVRDYEAWMFSWAAGLAAGANFPLGPRFTLCPVFSWRHTVYFGDYEHDYVADEGTPTESRWEESGSLDAKTDVFHFTLDLLF